MEKKLNLINNEFVIEDGVLKICNVDQFISEKIFEDGYVNNPEYTTIIIPEGVEVITAGSIYCEYDIPLIIKLPNSIKKIEESFQRGNYDDEDYDNVTQMKILLDFQDMKTAMNVLNNTDYDIDDDIYYDIGCDICIDDIPICSFTDIIIPNGVTGIGDCMFQDCENLKSVRIPDSVTSIGSWAFDDCTNLTSITIPNSVISIGYGAFFGCESLKSVTIPNSVMRIEKSAFKYCFNLTIKACPNSYAAQYAKENNIELEII